MGIVLIVLTTKPIVWFQDSLPYRTYQFELLSDGKYYINDLLYDFNFNNNSLSLSFEVIPYDTRSIRVEYPTEFHLKQTKSNEGNFEVFSQNETYFNSIAFWYPQEKKKSYMFNLLFEGGFYPKGNFIFNSEADIINSAEFESGMTMPHYRIFDLKLGKRYKCQNYCVLNTLRDDSSFFVVYDKEGQEILLEQDKNNKKITKISVIIDTFDSTKRFLKESFFVFGISILAGAICGLVSLIEPKKKRRGNKK